MKYKHNTKWETKGRNTHTERFKLTYRQYYLPIILFRLFSTIAYDMIYDERHQRYIQRRKPAFQRCSIICTTKTASVVPCVQAKFNKVFCTIIIRRRKWLHSSLDEWGGEANSGSVGERLESNPFLTYPPILTQYKRAVRSLSASRLTLPMHTA